MRKLNTDVSRGKTFVRANHSDEGVTAHSFTSTDKDSATPCSFNSRLGH